VAIFSEPQVSPKPARIIADELNIPIVDVDPLGQAGEDYIELMERNLNAIATGLE
jgi:ABC-type Zn uptake system ZnuABC Zn-binding protein ZnuA